MTQNNTPPAVPAPAKACWRRMSAGLVVALVLGVGAATLGSYLLADATFTPAAALDRTYLVSLPDDEGMLRALSEELLRHSSDEAAVLNEIAPAAGAPLGQPLDMPAAP